MQESQKSPMSPRKKAVVALLIVLALLVLIAVGAVAHVYGQISGVFDTGEAGSLSQDQDPDIEANGERFYNILVVGIDYDADAADGLHNYDEGKGMTDVVMYVQIDRDDGSIEIFQIPRDTYAGETFSDGSSLPTGKLNAVYSYGPDQENYINNLANKIYELFKLPVDNYVTIDMASFKTLVNVMGGITMYVPWDIVDGDTGALLVSQGTHTVSGDTAEVILRNRNYASADYQRLETQQYFYAALVRTFLEDYGLADYYNACKNLAVYINTDLSINELWGLYGTMTHVSAGDIFVVRAPGGAIAEYNGHTWLYGVDSDTTADILNTYFRDESMPVSSEQLGLEKGWDYTEYGWSVDEGRYLGALNNGSEGDPDDLLHQQLEQEQAAQSAG